MSATIVKRSGFDPNQPRAEDGKWTDGGASSSGADRLTPEERAAQPDYLKGTSWVPVPISVDSVAEVFTPEVLEELGVGGSEAVQRNALDADIRRAWATDGAMFIDRERKIVAVIDGDALDVEKHRSMIDYYIDTWEGVEAVSDSGGSVDLGRVAARVVDLSESRWFSSTTGDGVFLDPDYDGNSTPNEGAQERVARMLATAQTLQDLSNIGPVVLRIATPMSGEFERLDAGEALKENEPGRARGIARQPWSPVMSEWSAGQVPTIVMNTLGRGGVALDSNWVVNPYYRTGIEQDTQSPYLGTLIHEWGHQVQWARERTEGQSHNSRHTEAWTLARDGITTEYARTNRTEFYAEAFTAWAVDRIPELRRDGRYSEFANFADKHLGFSDFAGSKIDDVEFVMMDGIRVPIAKAKELVTIVCSFDPNFGSIYEYADGTTEVVNELDDVSKSSGFDPNQPRDEEGRWTDTGASASGTSVTTPDTTNTLSDPAAFDKVGEHLQSDLLTLASGLRQVTESPTGGLLGGYKHRNALDVADRLAESDVDPNDLLALIMNRDAIASAGSGVGSDLADSAAILGEQPDPRLPTGERLEVMGRNWENLANVVLGDGLPDDVGVIGVALPDDRWSVRLSRNPEQDVLDGRGEVVLRDGGQWGEDANRIMGYVAVDTLQRSWAQSSTGYSSDAMAAAVAEELGMSMPVSQSPDWSGISVDPSPYHTPEGRVHEARKAIARAMYENTQEQLRTLFPDRDSFVLYRGAAHGDLVNQVNTSRITGTSESETDQFGNWSQVAMYEREYKPLSSWTTDPKVAANFSWDETEFVAATVVPRERVFSTAFTGNGAFNESEFVVLGGRLPIAARTDMDGVQDITPTYLRARLANQSLDSDDFITINGQPVPVFKHLQGTEYDHDQSTHSGGKGGDVLRYLAPDLDEHLRDKPEGVSTNEYLAPLRAARQALLDSAFDNDPLSDDGGELLEMPDGRRLNSWQRARSAYVAERVANEDLIVHVNRALRDGSINMEEGPRHEYTDRVRQFDDMVNSTTVKRDVEVFRAAVLAPEQVDELTSGTEFIDRGFQSSDLTERTAVNYGFSRWAHGGRYQRGMRDGIPVVFRMRLKAGTNAVHVGNNEVVIQRDARVRVTSDPKGIGPAMRDGERRREFDYIGDPDSGYVHSPNFLVVDVEVSK